MGQRVPDACPGPCAATFVAWWRKCEGGAAARAMDASGEFTEFFRACLCTGLDCGPGGRCARGKCHCTEGWAGTACADVDECEQANGGCGHAPCTNAAGSASCGACPAGWTGPHCDLDVDECEGGRCGDALCHNFPGSARYVAVAPATPRLTSTQ